MKVYIVCDLEGTAGVTSFEHQQWIPGHWYEQSRRLATLELNAAVEGCLEAGATEIVAWDGHGNFPGGLDPELIHPACKVVTNGGDSGPLGLDSSFDALMQIGLHGMAHAQGGSMAHSFMLGVEGCWLNDRPFGEVSMNIWTAGLEGVPMVFLSGDVAAQAEARSLVPTVETAVVKWGYNKNAALSLAPLKAREVIREGARRALERLKEFEPVKPPLPFTFRIKYEKAEVAESRAKRPGVSRVDEFTVERECSGLDGFFI
ncbi:MAG TPA: M55 family metallopeptidase [Symbiobacteriaceae bacterium]|nr:M55 family metallopeptidase [Symbiobacteriaceae bacterium]